MRRIRRIRRERKTETNSCEKKEEDRKKVNEK